VARLLSTLALAAALAAAASVGPSEGSARVGLSSGAPAPGQTLRRAAAQRLMVAFGGRDRVSCGAGRDLVVADLTDSVARNCELVVRRVSVDTTLSSSAQHETAVEPDTFAWGSTVVALFQLGRFARGAAAAIGFATSHDAGRSWRTGTLPGLTKGSTLPGPWPRVSDPSISFDAVHRVWLGATLDVAGAEQQPGGSSGISVSRSSDGVHWQRPIQVATGPLLDKEWVACDNGASSPFRGRCYIVYTDDDLHRLVGQVSTDGGLTWSPPVRIADDLLGAQPLVRPDGGLVVAAVDLSQRGRGTILAFHSADGGTTFDDGGTVSDVVWHQPDRMRAIPLPSSTADVNGTLYVAWHDCRFAPTCAADDIVVARSTDGVTWSAPVRVTRGGNDHFVTGLDADPSQPGSLALVYELFEPGSCARGECRIGAAFARSRDGGATWSAPLRLDAQPFSESWIAESTSGRMVGDYFSVSFAAARVVPVFTLAAPPLKGRLREAIFAASLPAQ
jgi:hypothetical protein